MRGAPRSLSCAAVLALAGCSYDWSTPGAAADSGAVDTSVPVDAQQEAGVDATSQADATADAPVDAIDGAAESGPSCSDLEAQVHAARAAAVQCQPTASACMTIVQDECTCDVVMGGDAQSTATKAFVAAVGQLVAKCSPITGCPGCGSTPQKGLCIVSDAGSTGYACFQ